MEYSFELLAAPSGTNLLDLLSAHMAAGEMLSIRLERDAEDEHIHLYAVLNTQRKIYKNIYDVLQNHGFAPDNNRVHYAPPSSMIHRAAVTRTVKPAYDVISKSVSFESVISAIKNAGCCTELRIDLRILNPLEQTKLAGAQALEEQLISAGLRSGDNNAYYSKHPVLTELAISIAAEDADPAKNIALIIRNEFARSGVETAILQLKRSEQEMMFELDSFYQRFKHKQSKLSYALWFSQEEICNLQLSLSELFTSIVPESVQRIDEIDPVYLNPEIPVGHCKKRIVGFSRSFVGCALVGRTQNGKTKELLNIINASTQNKTSVIFFAPIKHDGRELLPNATIYTACGNENPLYLNLARPLSKEITMKQHRDSLVEAFTDVLSNDRNEEGSLQRLVGAGVDRMLANACYYDPVADHLDDGKAERLTLQHLCDGLQQSLRSMDYRPETRSHLETVLLNRLSEISSYNCFAHDNTNISFESMIQPGACTVFEMQELSNDYGKRLIFSFILNQLLHALHSVQLDHEVILALDECHIFFENKGMKTNSFYRLADNLRQDGYRGLKFIFTEQYASVLANGILESCDTIIAFCSEDDEPLSRALFNLLVPPLPMNRLPKRYAYLKTQVKPPVLFYSRDFEGDQNHPVVPADPNYVPFAGCEAICSECDQEKYKMARKLAGKHMSDYYRLCDRDSKAAKTTAAQKIYVETFKLKMPWRHCTQAMLKKAFVNLGISLHSFDIQLKPEKPPAKDNLTPKS